MTSTTTATHEEFENALEAEWAAVVEIGESVPTQYDAKRLDPKPSVWAKLTIRAGESDPVAIGGRYGTHRSIGIAFGQFHMMHGSVDRPLETAAELRRLCDVVAHAFRGRTIAGVGILSVSSINDGYVNGYHTRTARIAYQIDEE